MTVVRLKEEGNYCFFACVVAVFLLEFQEVRTGGPSKIVNTMLNEKMGRSAITIILA